MLACGGCGLGAGAPTKGVSLTVTREFGSHQIQTVSRSKVPGSETVMRMLERSFKLSTRYGGGFVESIDGLAPSGAHSDWFYYVNGVQASKGAATTAVHAGDHIWWDLHDWSATETIPAVVGSFPEPFTNGIGGQAVSRHARVRLGRQRRLRAGDQGAQRRAHPRLQPAARHRVGP